MECDKVGSPWNTITRMPTPNKRAQVEASKINAHRVLAPSKQAWPGRQGVHPPPPLLNRPRGWGGLAHVSRCPPPFLMQVRNWGRCPVQQRLGQRQNLHSMRLSWQQPSSKRACHQCWHRQKLHPPNVRAETPKHVHARYGAAILAQETC